MQLMVDILQARRRDRGNRECYYSFEGELYQIHVP